MVNSKRTQIIKWLLVLGLLLVVPIISFGQERSELMAEFNQQFAEYEKEVIASEFGAALKPAEVSFELGKKLFKPGGKNLVRLQHNLAVLLINLGREEEAANHLAQVLRDAEELYGKQAPELIEILFDFGIAKVKPLELRSEKRYFQRALRISKKSYGASSLEYGKLNLKVGNQITHRAHTQDGQPYIDRGIKVIEKVAGKDSQIYALAAFDKGKFELSTRDYKSAVKYLRRALHVFEKPGKSADKMRLITHAFLIKAYENLGEKKKATQHCLAIARMTPARGKQDLLPVFRAPLSYPRLAHLKSLDGWVDLIFDVDESGSVKNSRVKASSSKLFHRASLKAINRYRYAPAFDDGKPVMTKEVEIRFSFVMGR